MTKPKPVLLTDSERCQIAEVLERRANDISSFKSDLNRKSNASHSFDEFPGSVEMALSREILRLRKLAGLVELPKIVDED